jgi:hypothetical protein
VVPPEESQVPNRQLQEEGGSGVVAERQIPVPDVPSSHFRHPEGHPSSRAR